MKKTDVILLIVIVVIFLLGAFVIKAEEKDTGKKELVTELTYSEYAEKINANENFVVIIERTGCSHCENYMPIVKKVSKEYETNIYYIDIATLTEEELTNLESSNEYLSSNEWGTPTTLYLEGNKVIDTISGYVEKKELVEFLKNNEIIK